MERMLKAYTRQHSVRKKWPAPALEALYTPVLASQIEQVLQTGRGPVFPRDGFPMQRFDSPSLTPTSIPRRVPFCTHTARLIPAVETSEDSSNIS